MSNPSIMILKKAVVYFAYKPNIFVSKCYIYVESMGFIFKFHTTTLKKNIIFSKSAGYLSGRKQSYPTSLYFR
jgi:hypothetical protein